MYSCFVRYFPLHVLTAYRSSLYSPSFRTPTKSTASFFRDSERLSNFTFTAESIFCFFAYCEISNIFSLINSSFTSHSLKKNIYLINILTCTFSTMLSKLAKYIISNSRLYTILMDCEIITCIGIRSTRNPLKLHHIC